MTFVNRLLGIFLLIISPICAVIFPMFYHRKRVFSEVKSRFKFLFNSAIDLIKTGIRND